MNNWRDGNSIGTLYTLEKNDLSRIGDCWLKGRLRAGDVILCVAHSGDCFNDYVLINPFLNGLNAILGSEFGAYVLGKKLNWQPSKKEYHLLMAGKTLLTNNVERHPLSIELENLRNKNRPRKGIKDVFKRN